MSAPFRDLYASDNVSEAIALVYLLALALPASGMAIHGRQPSSLINRRREHFVQNSGRYRF